MRNIAGGFFATFIKDLFVIWRDKPGMLVLFFMPMAFVVVVSLVQNNVMQATGEASLELLLVNEDRGDVGDQLRSRLESSGYFKTVEKINGNSISRERAQKLIGDGVYQFGIFIPRGTTKNVQSLTEEMAAPSNQGEENSKTAPVIIELFVDPTVQMAFRVAVTSSLYQALLDIEVASKGQAIRDIFAEMLPNAMGDTDSNGNFMKQPFFAVTERGSVGVEKPNATQQNIPAWSLFGMFFIVVPLSAAFIRERQEGTLHRVFVHPVPFQAIIAGKVAAYMLVCLIQFSLMLLAGKFLLPLFGPPAILLSGKLPLAYLLATCAAFAATGYGLLLGSIARTYDQGTMFGAVSVVIAAAIGGIMIPAYVMPPSMQTLSQISPLAWGLDGFVDLFVRGAGFMSILPNMGLLAGFGAVCLIGAQGIISKRYNKGTL